MVRKSLQNVDMTRFKRVIETENYDYITITSIK